MAAFDPGPVLPPNVVDEVASIGPLEEPWIWQSLAALAIAAATGVYLRRRRRGWRYGLIVVLVLALAGAAVTGLNSYVGYVRNRHDLARLLERGPGVVRALGRAIEPGAATPQAGGSYRARARGRLARARHAEGADEGFALRRLALPAPGLRIPVGANEVLLPPGYDAPANRARRYPVVYLIHGYPYGSAQDWFTAGDAINTMGLLLRDRLVPPMILVAPDMTAGDPSRDFECLNVPAGPQLETYLTTRLIPAVEHRYRAVPSRAGRALGGMSGGAFCALNIGLHHVRLFSSLLATEPYDTPGDARSLLGHNPALIRANTPRGYLPTMAFPARIATLLDVPTGAPSDVDTGTRLASALTRRGQPVALRKEHGFNHTWYTARAALPYLLTFAANHFTPNATHTPAHRPPRRALALPVDVKIFEAGWLGVH